MEISYLFSGIPTADFSSAVVWYERLFGRPPDRFPHEHEAVWHLTESGLIYLVADPAHAGNALLTLIVDDLEATVAELERRGIQVAPPETIPGAARKVDINDPDGNSLAFAQVLGQS